MTTPGPSPYGRIARKVFVRDRQRMVITIAISLLAAALVVSILVLLGVFKTTEQKQTEAAVSNYGVAVPCLADGTTAPDTTQITVRVLNGTGMSGIARAVSQALNYRGFVIQGAADFDNHDVTRTEIRFGKNGLAEAYTLYAQFNDALLRMDDRDDKLVDVVIGSSFEDLNDSDQVALSSGADLKSLADCVAVDTMTKLPPASKHDAVN